MEILDNHRLTGARWAPSPHHDARPAGASVELAVVHCVSLPEGVYGTGAPERLFLGALDTSEHASFADLDGLEVAPHLLIDRAGTIVQFVAFDRRAWHAGVSSWRGRAGCNAYSVGIELEGCVADGYDARQYESLRRVLVTLVEHYAGLSVERIVGHAEIAPGRKQDPGPAFDWSDLLCNVTADVAAGGPGRPPLTGP